MTTTTTTTVLIVGAGPAGLALGITLLHSGFKDFVIVDAQERGRNASRAVVVHAKTLEELDTLGCAEALIEAGIKAQQFLIRVKSGPLVGGRFELVKDRTRYPFACLLDQSKTEQILEDKLHALVGNVKRLCKLEALEVKPTELVATLENGEKVSAKYVIGADGARSFVRKAMGISFQDPHTGLDTHTARSEFHRYVIADVEFDQTPPFASRLQVTVSFGPSGLFLIIPLSSSHDHLWRVSLPVPDEMDGPPTQEFLNLALKQVQSPKDTSTVKVTAVHWTSSFNIRRGVASQFYKAPETSTGRIVLIGDAGHIHSPAGGQGMNMGIQDGIALGRLLSSLAPSSSHSNPDPKLDSALAQFGRERREHALGIINITNRLTKMSELRNPLALVLRNTVMRIIGSLDLLTRRFVRQISGV